MTKTTIKPWHNKSVLVEIESLEPLTEEEKLEVARGIRVAFSWCFLGEPWPSLGEIKEAIEPCNPELASKLISKKYC